LHAKKKINIMADDITKVYKNTLAAFNNVFHIHKIPEFKDLFFGRCGLANICSILARRSL
jgi:hypothetical protein